MAARCGMPLIAAFRLPCRITDRQQSNNADRHLAVFSGRRDKLERVLRLIKAVV